MELKQGDMIKLAIAIVIFVIAIIVISINVFSRPAPSRPSRTPAPSVEATGEPREPPQPGSHRVAPPE